PHPLASKLAHVEARLTEKLHVLGRHGDRKIGAVVSTKIDIGASLDQRCRLHGSFNDLEGSGALVELFRAAQGEQPIAPMAGALRACFTLSGDKFFVAEGARAAGCDTNRSCLQQGSLERGSAYKHLGEHTPIAVWRTFSI